MNVQTILFSFKTIIIWKTCRSTSAFKVLIHQREYIVIQWKQLHLEACGGRCGRKPEFGACSAARARALAQPRAAGVGARSTLTERVRLS